MELMKIFYNPEMDLNIGKKYISTETLFDKEENKRFIQERFGLPHSDDIPLIAMITRLHKTEGIRIGSSSIR